MTPEYITKDTLKETLIDWSCDASYIEVETKWALEEIKNLPAADVAPVRYGCWNADKEDVEWGNSLIRYRCSVCNERPHFDKEEYKFILSPYCPNCGAKMDGDGE